MVDPASGIRRVTAIDKALRPRSVVCRLSMDQPMTRREKASRTAAQYAGGVFGDVGQLQQIGRLHVEGAAHQVVFNHRVGPA